MRELLPVGVRMFDGFRFMLSLSSWTEFTEWRICKRLQNNYQAYILRCFLRQQWQHHEPRTMAVELRPLTFDFWPLSLNSTSNASTYKLYLVIGKLYLNLCSSTYSIKFFTLRSSLFTKNAYLCPEFSRALPSQNIVGYELAFAISFESYSKRRKFQVFTP